MRRLFKTIDERLREIGFEKTIENEHGAFYEREEPRYYYTHCLNLIHRSNGEWLVQSYQKEDNSDGFNNAIGLTPYEMELALKKIKKMKQAAGNDMACYL